MEPRPTVLEPRRTVRYLGSTEQAPQEGHSDILDGRRVAHLQHRCCGSENAESIQGDNGEVMLGELATQKGLSCGVKEFGKTLMDDDNKAITEKMNVAQKIGAKLPEGPTRDAQAEYTKLSKMSGATFDRKLIMHMTMDHNKDIKEFEDESKARHAETSELAMIQLFAPRLACPDKNRPTPDKVDF